MWIVLQVLGHLAETEILKECWGVFHRGNIVDLLEYTESESN